jgi:fructoselysine 6-kinase
VTEGSPRTVAVVGDNTIDRYVGLGARDFVGGNAVNVAVQLRLRGDKVAYFGAVGADDDGTAIERALSDASLDIQGLERVNGATAVTTIRLTESGDRVFESEDFGVTADYYPDPSALRAIAAASWVHLGMIPRAAELVSQLHRLDPSLRISQDCSVSSGYGGLTVAFDSAGEDLERGRDCARNAIAQGARLAIVTLGALGAIAYDGTTWWMQEPLPVEVVDTTGAGDSFTAGVLDALTRGDTVSEALAVGAEWAAQTCSHLAGFPQ